MSELGVRLDSFWSRAANRQVARAAGVVASVAILVKLVATVKEFAVAGLYGRSDAMDAFLAASLVPALLVNLISESMNQALIPTLVRVRAQQGLARAQQLLSSSMLWTCLLLAAASLAMAAAAPWFFPLIASNFAADKLHLSVRLFYGLLPTVLFAGVAANCVAVLNTAGKFAAPALAPAAIPLAILAVTPLLRAQLGIWALAVSTVVGTLLYAALSARLMHSSGYKFHLAWSGPNEATREVARQYGPVLLSSVVASGGLLVDQAMAAMLPAGSVSALVYANRFVSVTLTLLAGAVSSAVTPAFSELVAAQDWRECRRMFTHWLALMAAVSIPIAAALILGAHWLIRLTFQHGAFHAADTAVVTPVLAMYALQIPFFACSRVPYRLIVAMRRTDLVFYCGLINLALDIALNLVLMRRFGVAGIALATSLWTASTFLFLTFWARRLLRSRLAESPQ